jgi:transcriptional regulator with XRE-family HTH domain
MAITGAEIKRRRTNLGLSQQQLAVRLDVKKNTIARWEREEITPEHPAMLELALRSLEQELSPQTQAELLAYRQRIDSLGKKTRKALDELISSNTHNS